MLENADRKLTSVVIHEEACQVERWDNPSRGDVRWQTLLSSEQTHSHSMTCGVTEIGVGGNGILNVHRHVQPEIYYVLAGQGIVTLDGAEHHIKAGSTVFIPGGMEHAVRNTGEQPLRFFYVFAADSFQEIQYEFKVE